MKKILSIALVGAMFAVYSCGPSAEETANAEKATADSIAAAQSAEAAAKAAADSMAAAEANAVQADTAVAPAPAVNTESK